METFEVVCLQFNPITGDFFDKPKYKKIEGKEEVLEYMKSFKSSAVVAGIPLIDKIAKEQTDVPMNTFNDGEYYWTSREIYYLDKYDLELKQEFVDKVKGING